MPGLYDGMVGCNRFWVTLIYLLPLIGTLHLVHWIGAALFTPSPAMNEIRKKAGSVVWGKNRSGPFIMDRKKGRNPRSIKQLEVRGNTSNLSKTWTTRAVNHKAFIEYANQVTVQNVLGQPIHISAINWFVKLNKIIDSLGGQG